MTKYQVRLPPTPRKPDWMDDNRYREVSASYLQIVEMLVDADLRAEAGSPEQAISSVLGELRERYGLRSDWIYTCIKKSPDFPADVARPVTEAA